MAEAALKKESKTEWLTHPIQDLLKLLCLKKQNKQPPKRVVYVNYPNGKKKEYWPHISNYTYKINFRLVVDLN